MLEFDDQLRAFAALVVGAFLLAAALGELRYGTQRPNRPIISLFLGALLFLGGAIAIVIDAFHRL